MFANITVHALGALILLFILWKKLKDDATSEITFSLGFLVILAILLAQKYFWLQILGIGLISGFCIWKFRMRVNEVLDSLVIALLPWLALSFLKISVVKTSIESFVYFVVILILMGVYYLIDANYKKFAWYKSGKIGLAGAVTLLLLIIFYCVTLFL